MVATQKEEGVAGGLDWQVTEKAGVASVMRRVASVMRRVASAMAKEASVTAMVEVAAEVVTHSHPHGNQRTWFHCSDIRAA